MSYRILVADGHWLIRRGLRATLHQVDDQEVVGEASDVSSAVTRAVDLVPDMVLVDVALPGDGGLAAARMIKSRKRDQKVLLLGDLGGEALVRDALRAGCDGYVRKDASAIELFEAIRSVRSGQVYLDAEMTRKLVLADFQRETGVSAHPLDCLSPRELTVFRLVAEGLTNRGVGENMHLSPKTVEKYRASLMQKLKLQSALELRMFAMELGVVQGARRLNRPDQAERSAAP
jgi:DNA-binding NarL/FixJ family response regulator